MKTRTEELASEWGLDFIEITEGMNGYPKNLYKALIGFDTYEDAESFADEVNGEVVLLTKRDGHQLWFNSGRQYEALERAKFIDENDEIVFENGGSFEDWAQDEIRQMVEQHCSLVDLKAALIEMCATSFAIYESDATEVAVVNTLNYTCDITPKYTTDIHDNDVTTYAIAVVDHETDEEETKEEEED